MKKYSFKILLSLLLLIFNTYGLYAEELDIETINRIGNNFQKYSLVGLEDQNGEIHSLSDYKGKVVVLTFIATWCPDCVNELSDIKEAYQFFGSNKDDVVFLSVVQPKTENYPENRDKTIPEIMDFIKKYKINYPILFDMSAEYFVKHEIKNFPTTYVIDKNGFLNTYIKGEIREEELKNIIKKIR